MCMLGKYKTKFEWIFTSYIFQKLFFFQIQCKNQFVFSSYIFIMSYYIVIMKP